MLRGTGIFTSKLTDDWPANVADTCSLECDFVISGFDGQSVLTVCYADWSAVSCTSSSLHAEVL